MYLDGHLLAFLGIVNRFMVVLNGRNSSNVDEVLLRNANWGSDLHALETAIRNPQKEKRYKQARNQNTEI